MRRHPRLQPGRPYPHLRGGTAGRWSGHTAPRVATGAMLDWFGQPALEARVHHGNWHRPHQGIGAMTSMAGLKTPANNLLTRHS